MVSKLLAELLLSKLLLVVDTDLNVSLLLVVVHTADELLLFYYYFQLFVIAAVASFIDDVVAFSDLVGR
jgi:hypothetical protein